MYRLRRFIRSDALIRVRLQKIDRLGYIYVAYLDTLLVDILQVSYISGGTMGYTISEEQIMVSLRKRVTILHAPLPREYGVGRTCSRLLVRSAPLSWR
jgi:hypothetical protein